MIDGRRVPGAVTRAVEGWELIDRVESRFRGRHQEVALVPIDEQHGAVQRGEPGDVVPLRTRVEYAIVSTRGSAPSRSTESHRRTGP